MRQSVSHLWSRKQLGNLFGSRICRQLGAFPVFGSAPAPTETVDPTPTGLRTWIPHTKAAYEK
ncbi:hypothetical protein QQ045_018962 [Rhodiola kirilowii]